MSKVAIYMLTRDRLDYTKRTLTTMYKKAGHKFDLYVFDNGSTDGTHKWLKNSTYPNLTYFLNKENYGQHIASNRVIAHIREQDDYDYIMRVDNDCEFKSKRWLKKLVAAHKSMFKDGMAIISPVVRGLNNPPEPYGINSNKCYVYFFVEIVGGICRMHPTKFFKGFKFNERQPLAMGEAYDISQYCMKNKIPMAYIAEVNVKHMETTGGQLERLPDYFDRSEMERHLPHGI